MSEKLREEDIPSLDELDRKISEAQRRALGDDKPRNTSGGAMNLTIELISGLLAGLVIGYYIDSWFNTKPIFLIICFILGFCGAFLNIVRSTNKPDNDGNK